MDRKIAKTTLLVVGLCLVLSLAYNVPRCLAQNSWSDDFSDGNYIGWTVEEGTFNASNYLLETTGDAGGTGDWHNIRHNSEVAYGNWSLDMYINATGDLAYYISFIADALFEYGPGFLMPRNGYVVYFISWGPEVGLERWTNNDYTAIGNKWNPSALKGWQNITITRERDTGAFTVSVNGTSRITATDNTHTVSHRFSWSCDPWSAIDNVVVNEQEIIIIQPPPIPIELILIGVGVIIIVIVIIAVIFLRRRG